MEKSSGYFEESIIEENVESNYYIDWFEVVDHRIRIMLLDIAI